MLTASKIVPRGQGLAAVLLKRAATVALDWDVRQRSRFEAVDSSGRRLGVFLPRGSVVRGGDVLVTEDGSLVRVEAAPQPVMVVRHCQAHGTPFDLVRAAYHLGNRHVPLELQPDHLKFEPDPVLADMLDRMHLIVREELLPFEPEGGAYQPGATPHGHGHSDHAHGHGHAHDHGHDHGQPPAHGPGHTHDHAHDHSHHEHGHSHPHDPIPAQGPALPHDPAATQTPATGVGAAPGHVHGPGCGHDH